MKTNEQIDALIIRKLCLAFDEFIGACLKDAGPTKQDIAKARGYLPPYCKHAYQKKKR